MLGALRIGAAAEALVSFDVCVPGFLSRKDWFSREPNGYFYPGVYVGMGFGLPVGIGAKLARPDRPVCVVAGDGGFQMTMAELGTAAQRRSPLVVVVVNDAGLTLIRRVQDRDFGGRRCEVDLVNPDFVRLAAGVRHRGGASGHAGGARERRFPGGEAWESLLCGICEVATWRRVRGFG